MKVWYSTTKPPKNIDAIWINNLQKLKEKFPIILWYECKGKSRIRRKYYNGIEEFIICPSRKNDYMMVLEILRNINTTVTIRSYNIFTKMKMRKFMQENDIPETK